MFKTKRFWFLVIGSLVIIWNLVLGAWNLPDCYAQSSTKDEEALFVAQKAFDDGFYDVSLQLLERFQKDFPVSRKLAEARLYVGKCYFSQGKYMDALKVFEELQESPDAANLKDSLFYWIAEVHFRGNDFRQAAVYYQKIIDGFPKSEYLEHAYYSLGFSLLELKEFKDAIKYFEVVKDKYRSSSLSADAAFKIAVAFYGMKDYPGLKNYIISYIKAYPKDTGRLTSAYFYLAESDYYQDNFASAIDEYNQAMRLSSDEKMQALLKLNIGWSYLRLKKYNEAESLLNQVNASILEQRNREVLSLGKAALLTQTHNYDKSVIVYDELIKGISTSTDVLMQAYIGKADCLYNLARYKEAQSVYKEAQSKNTEAVAGPYQDQISYGLAWAYLKEGDFKEAIAEFQKAVKDTSDKTVKVAALCQVGDAYQDAGDYQKAREAYDTILRDYADSFYGDYVQYQLGVTFLKESRYDAAILAFKALAVNFSKSKLADEAMYSLGIAYFQKEDYALAKESFENFLGEFKESSLRKDAIYLLASSLFNLGKFQDAITVFKNVIRDYGQDIKLVQKSEYEIADCYYQLGDEGKAMSMFKQLRSKYPDSSLTPEVIWWLGEYYYRHQDYSLAKRYFSSLIRDYPKSSLVADAYYAIGSLLAEDGELKEAADNFKKAIESGDSDLSGQAAIALADISVKENNLEEASKIYKEVLEKHPNLEAVLYPKIAGILRKNGSFNEAVDFYRKALDVAPLKQRSSIEFEIAQCLEEALRPDDAVSEYLKITYLYSDDNPLSVKAFLRVAKIYEDKEKFNEAKNIYQKISEMNVEEAKYARERLVELDKK